MKEADTVIVLGWGSLVWDPRELKISGEWLNDGPHLPIEFARISSDGRLTLVRKSDAKSVQVLWNRMSINLEEAIDNLQKREGCSIERIGYLDLDNGKNQAFDKVFMNKISEWCEANELRKVIWTDLGVNLKKKVGEIFSEDIVMKYLSELKDQTSAREYIQKTPSQVATSLRSRIEEELGWLPLKT